MDASLSLVALLFTVKEKLGLESPSFVSSSTLQLDKDMLTMVLGVKSTAFKVPSAPFIRQFFTLLSAGTYFPTLQLDEDVWDVVWHVKNQHFKDAYVKINILKMPFNSFCWSILSPHSWDTVQCVKNQH
ncbi:MAG: hypothetical protein LGB70_07270 [Sulfurovum sp.]|nr:hypothetical protein [Sulfurovum sp.]MCB4784479.1 hypothetical protein [Sulfurovum sp.]